MEQKQNNFGNKNQKQSMIPECKIRLSKDGRYVLVQVTFTDIKPVAYYKKVLESAEQKNGA